MYFESHAELMDQMEWFKDYSAVIKSALHDLREAGLSEEASENVLLARLNIPGYVRDDDWDDYDDWDDDPYDLPEDNPWEFAPLDDEED